MVLIKWFIKSEVWLDGNVRWKVTRLIRYYPMVTTVIPECQHQVRKLLCLLNRKIIQTQTALIPLSYAPFPPSPSFPPSPHTRCSWLVLWSELFALWFPPQDQIADALLCSIISVSYVVSSSISGGSHNTTGTCDAVISLWCTEVNP